VVHPMEAVPLLLTVTNLTAGTVAVDDLPMHGEVLSDFAAVRTPAGTEVKLYQVQSRLESACDIDHRLRIEPGASHDFHLLLGYRQLEQAALFDEVGTYGITVVFASASSPPVTIECVAAPQCEEPALEIVRGLQKQSLLNGYFDGRFLEGRSYQGHVQDIERLAW